MKMLPLVAFAFIVSQVVALSGEEFMPMHPGAAYQAPGGQTGSRPASQLRVNQVRLRLPSAAPVEQRPSVVESGIARPEFPEARTVEFPSMGIPGLVSPEMLALDYDFADMPFVEPEPVASPWTIDTFGNDRPMMPVSVGEPLVVEMPPPISSAANLPIPPQGGRMYEEVPMFYSSVPPVEAWSRPRIR